MLPDDIRYNKWFVSKDGATYVLRAGYTIEQIQARLQAAKIDPATYDVYQPPTATGIRNVLVTFKHAK